jgi:hypothetical protein
MAARAERAHTPSGGERPLALTSPAAAGPAPPRPPHALRPPPPARTARRRGQPSAQPDAPRRQHAAGGARRPQRGPLGCPPAAAALPVCSRGAASSSGMALRVGRRMRCGLPLGKPTAAAKQRSGDARPSAGDAFSAFGRGGTRGVPRRRAWCRACAGETPAARRIRSTPAIGTHHGSGAALSPTSLWIILGSATNFQGNWRPFRGGGGRAPADWGPPNRQSTRHLS